MWERCSSPAWRVYGANYDDPTWFADSPIAQVPTITCPVSVYFSTADVLVPINQVGARWVQPFEKSQFPDGFTMDPEKLMASREGRLRLVDVLPEAAYEVFNLAVPEGTSRHNVPGGPGHPTTCELPVSADKLWSIGIIDEGPAGAGRRSIESTTSCRRGMPFWNASSRARSPRASSPRPSWSD